ncbi:MAG: SGNH/GDSL hydrolase family protein [Akkermansiaceae bacterium]
MKRRRFFMSGAAVAAGAATCGGANGQVPDSEVGGYDYRRPGFQKGSRLLFQGDSITDMKWGRNQADRNHYLGHSYVYLIASRLGVDLPEAQLEVYNRGMSGHKVGDLRGRWQKDAIEMKPDLLSVLIGVNDVGRNIEGVDVEVWEEDYRFILEASRKANPKLRLVLLDPFVLPSGRFEDGDLYKKWRDQVERLISIVGSLVKDYDAVRVETQKIFDAAAKAVSPGHWLWDGVHPLPQGHELIARNWLQEVSGRWG